MVKRHQADIQIPVRVSYFYNTGDSDGHLKIGLICLSINQGENKSKTVNSPQRNDIRSLRSWRRANCRRFLLLAFLAAFLTTTSSLNGLLHFQRKFYNTTKCREVCIPEKYGGIKVSENFVSVDKRLVFFRGFLF